jgi:hypothetical protein
VISATVVMRKRLPSWVSTGNRLSKRSRDLARAARKKVWSRPLAHGRAPTALLLSPLASSCVVPGSTAVPSISPTSAARPCSPRRPGPRLRTRDCLNPFATFAIQDRGSKQTSFSLFGTPEQQRQS